MSDVRIYVATSIKGVGKKKGKYIYLIETETTKGLATLHDVKEIESTNYVAELAAVVAAVSRLKQKPLEVEIYVSSQQLRLNLTHYLKLWAKSNFCGADGRRLSCWELYKSFWENTRLFSLRVHVKQHSYSNWLLNECQ